MKELEDIKRGPGSYDLKHKLTELRTDKGIRKFQEPNEIKEVDEEDERPDLYPNYEHDKTRKLVFKYHEPSNDLGP